MAGDEAGRVRGGLAGGKTRPGRRAPATIELSAAQVSMPDTVDVGAAAAEALVTEPATGPTPAPEQAPAPEPVTAAAPPPSDLPPRAPDTTPAASPPASSAPRTGGIIGGGLAGLAAGIAAAVGVGWMTRPAVPDPAPRLAAIEAAQAQFARGPAVAELAAEMGRLKASIETLRTDIGRQLDGQRTAAEKRVADIDAAARQLAGRLDSLSMPAAGGGATIDIGPLTRRVEDLAASLAGAEKRMGDLDGAARAAAEAARTAAEQAGGALARATGTEDGLKQATALAGQAAEQAKQALAGLEALPARLEPEIAGLGERLKELAGRQETVSAAPVLAAVQALAAAVRRGDPFVNELAAVDALRVAPEKTAALRPFAEKGAPTPAALLAAFRPLASPLAASGPSAGGVTGVLSRFVNVRPVGEPAGNEPPALVARIEAALARGDTARALVDWGLLPEPARRLSASFADLLSQRDRAAKALAALEQDAIAALRKGGS